MAFPVTGRDHPTLISRSSEAAPSSLERLSGSWFFAFGVALFIVSAVLSGGVFAYRKYLESERTTLAMAVKEREQALQSDSLHEIIAFSQSLNAAETLLAEHPFPSNIFPFLQKNTHQGVQWKSFSFAGLTRRVDMNAVARSYRAVAEQISVLEGVPDVESVSFGGLSLSGSGLVSFHVGLVLKPSMFPYRTP